MQFFQLFPQNEHFYTEDNLRPAKKKIDFSDIQNRL